eukprot:gene12646-biopygen11014
MQRSSVRQTTVNGDFGACVWPTHLPAAARGAGVVCMGVCVGGGGGARARAVRGASFKVPARGAARSWSCVIVRHGGGLVVVFLRRPYRTNPDKPGQLRGNPWPPRNPRGIKGIHGSPRNSMAERGRRLCGWCCSPSGGVPPPHLAPRHAGWRR